MAISLEVKKFVNTEYVGKFAEIELPIAQPEDEEPPRKARKKPDKKDKKEKKASFIRKRADYDGDDDDYDDIDSEIEAELDAEEEELCKVEGVGPATARMLHLMPEICKYYTRCRASEENCLRTTEQLAEFLKSKFLGADRERALLMALDSRSRVRGAYWLREGTSSKVSFEIKDVVAAALKGGTDSVVLCHNHPNGMAMPSREDLQATENIVRALGLVKIQLRDHLILTETEYFSMREEGRLPFYDFESGQMLRPY